MIDLEKARREFKSLIDRCGCSRASLHITKEEVNKINIYGIKPVEPHCTPKRCFPILYNLLYPKGGFNHVSYLVQNFRKRKKEKK